MRKCCPNSLKASQRVLSLPVHPGLSEGDIQLSKPRFLRWDGALDRYAF
jgi:hypothetical protein